MFGAIFCILHARVLQPKLNETLHSNRAAPGRSDNCRRLPALLDDSEIGCERVLLLANGITDACACSLAEPCLLAPPCCRRLDGMMRAQGMVTGSVTGSVIRVLLPECMRLRQQTRDRLGNTQ